MIPSQLTTNISYYDDYYDDGYHYYDYNPQMGGPSNILRLELNRGVRLS